MPHDPHLADRMRHALREDGGITERKMFGGYCWMHHGYMGSDVEVGRFMLRAGKGLEARAVARFADIQIGMDGCGYAARLQNFDGVFAAVVDPTGRGILSRLAAGEASVSEIAGPFEMSQPAVSKHLKVLERAGLIERDIDKQRRPARLKAEPMAAAVSWLEEFKRFWLSSFDQLDGLLEGLKKAERKRLRRKGPKNA